MRGGVCVVSVDGTFTIAANSAEDIGTLPEGMRPASRAIGAATANVSERPSCCVYVNENGVFGVSAVAAMASDRVRGQVIFIAT